MRGIGERRDWINYLWIDYDDDDDNDDDDSNDSSDDYDFFYFFCLFINSFIIHLKEGIVEVLDCGGSHE